MKKEIRGFHGEYRFLSNFYPIQITFEGVTYESTEAAYQASKTADEVLKKKFSTLNAREARRLGRNVPLRQDWESEKLNVMYRILREKFSKDPIRSMLLSTEDANLEEINYWHDTFWGIYNGIGENHLGKLLMLVRNEITEGII